MNLRRFLIEDSLVAVVSLPAGVFKPYSGVKTSILFLDKSLARQTTKILFLKISADGFDLGDKRDPVEANDLPQAERVVTAWFKKTLGELTEAPIPWKLVEKQESCANKDVTLNAERYMQGVAVGIDDHEIVTIGAICLDVQSGYSCPSTNRRQLVYLTFDRKTSPTRANWYGRARSMSRSKSQRQKKATRFAEATSSSITPIVLSS